MSIEVTKTYHAIVEMTEIDHKLFLSNMPRPLPGTAIVLSKDRGTFAGGGIKLIEHEIKNGDIRFGGYKRFYRIDTSQQSISYRCCLPADNCGNAFVCDILLNCKVTDPLYVVMENASDIAEKLKVEIYKGLCNRSQTIEISDEDPTNRVRGTLEAELSMLSRPWLDFPDYTVEHVALTEEGRRILENERGHMAILSGDPYEIAKRDESGLLGRGHGVMEEMRQEKQRTAEYSKKMLLENLEMLKMLKEQNMISPEEYDARVRTALDAGIGKAEALPKSEEAKQIENTDGEEDLF